MKYCFPRWPTSSVIIKQPSYGYKTDTIYEHCENIAVYIVTARIYSINCGRSKQKMWQSYLNVRKVQNELA